MGKIMPFFETIDQVISAFSICLIGFILVEIIRKKFYLKWKISHLIYIWHTLFGFVYLLYLDKNQGDAQRYYLNATFGEFNFGIGTSFVEFFTALFVVPFHLSFLGAFLVFNIFGSLGLLAFYASLNNIVKSKTKFIKRLAIITVFLPSISFWTVAIGKDSLAFMVTGFALWAALNLKKRILLMIFAIVVMGMVRPHIAGIMIISLSIAIIFDKKTRLPTKFVLSILSVSAVAILVPFALQYVGLENITQESALADYIDKRQSYNQQGAGGVDISSMSLPVQLYTYVVRPMPFEAHSITALAASFDNLFLFYLFILFLYGFYKNRKFQHKYNIIFMLSFAIATWVILAITTSNLGIAMRQKWMFLPFLIFIFFLYYPNSRKS